VRAGARSTARSNFTASFDIVFQGVGTRIDLDRQRIHRKPVPGGPLTGVADARIAPG
jgi:hypothetical protein